MCGHDHFLAALLQRMGRFFVHCGNTINYAFVHGNLEMRPEYLLGFFRVFEGWLLLFPLSILTISLFLVAGPAPLWMVHTGSGIVIIDVVLAVGFVWVFGGTSIIGVCSVLFQCCLFPFSVYYEYVLVGPNPTWMVGSLMGFLAFGALGALAFVIEYFGKSRNQVLLELSRLLGGDNVIIDRRLPSELRKPVIVSSGFIICMMAAFAIGTVGRDPVASSHALFFVIMNAVMVLFVYGMVLFMTKRDDEGALDRAPPLERAADCAVVALASQWWPSSPLLARARQSRCRTDNSGVLVGCPQPLKQFLMHQTRK
jgi:hypothetical protein